MSPVSGCGRRRQHGVADPYPRVVQRARIAVDVERIGDFLRRHRELSFTSPLAPNALADGSANGTTALREIGSYRLVGGVARGLEELERTDQRRQRPTTAQTILVVWRFRTGRSSGSSSSSPVGWSLRLPTTADSKHLS